MSRYAVCTSTCEIILIEWTSVEIEGLLEAFKNCSGLTADDDEQSV